VIYLLALIPATVLAIAGYVVLVLSSRAEGGLRSFGRYLGFWAFTLAGLVILGALFAAAHHHHGEHCCPFMTHCAGMGDGRDAMYYCPWSSGPRSGMGERDGEGRGPPPPASGPGDSAGSAPSPRMNN
jgi:hypothetical protein